MGRYSREHTAANRERVITEAAKLLQERGLNGVGVADLMAAAGLTHGGFYRHFASKDELAVAVAEHLAVQGAERWRTLAEEARAEGGSGLDALVDAYLSENHRNAVAGGCAFAALGSEYARLGPELRVRVAASAERFVAVLADEMQGDTAEQRTAAALTAYCGMVGALVLSRLGVGPDAGAGLLPLVSDGLKQLSGSPPGG